jgi:hypothetical protein
MFHMGFKQVVLVIVKCNNVTDVRTVEWLFPQACVEADIGNLNGLQVLVSFDSTALCMYD